MKAAIIGVGVVGKAQARLLTGYDLITYDSAWGTPYPHEAIAECDFAIVTVGTPAREDGSADLTNLDAALAVPSGDLPVLIRSTVPPGTTARLAAARGGHTCYAPEFIYEGGSGPWHESADVPFMILGGLYDARLFFFRHLAKVFPGEIHGTGATTAELAKYAANLHWATRVTLVSELAAVAESFGVDWEAVRSAWLLDTRVNPAHTAMAGAGYGPGFGGRCWPKDLSALIAAADAAGYKAGFLKAVQEANARFRP